MQQMCCCLLWYLCKRMIIVFKKWRKVLPLQRETEVSYDKNKVDTYQGSRSPQYDNTDIRRYSERLGSASPALDGKTSSRQFDRDDRSGYPSQDRSTVDQQFPDSSKRELMSPNQQKEVDASKSPKSQPVSVVSIPPASIGEPAKPSGLQLPRSSAHVQVNFLALNKTHKVACLFCLCNNACECEYTHFLLMKTIVQYHSVCLC